jgi:hypothetical protein
MMYVYTWFGMNFFVTAIICAGFITNFSLFTVIILLYFLMPKHVIDSWLQAITRTCRSLFSETIGKIEDNIRKTFQIKVLYPIPERSIRIWNPHAISAVAVGIHNGFRITDDALTPSKIVTHHAVQYSPIFSDLLRQIHCIFSHFHEIKDALKTDSITIVLGGVDEMRRLKEKEIQLVIKKRKGIFKIALETGIPIVPVITYGEIELFPESDDDFLLYINGLLYENFRIRIPFPSVKSVMNWATLMAKPLEPILTYTGKPIHVKKIEDPTETHIKILRNLYIKRIKELFDETNPGDFSLRII